MDVSVSPMAENDPSAEEVNPDDRSFANKMAHLESVGLVTPIVLDIPLDDDLSKIYASMAQPGMSLSTTEILLIQVLRLLREQQKK